MFEAVQTLNKKLYVIIGTKVDMVLANSSLREVSIDEAHNLAQRLNSGSDHVYETSAKTGFHVREVFEFIASKEPDFERSSVTPSLNLNTPFTRQYYKAMCSGCAGVQFDNSSALSGLSTFSLSNSETSPKEQNRSSTDYNDHAVDEGIPRTLYFTFLIFCDLL